MFRNIVNQSVRLLSTAARANAQFRVATAQRYQAAHVQQLTASGSHVQVQGVAGDFSGTFIDKFSWSPTHTLVATYKEMGIAITMDEISPDMGKHKKNHIEALFKMQSVQQKWKRAHGKLPESKDVDTIFNRYVVKQHECLKDFCQLIPHTKETILSLQSNKISVGASTGFMRSMVNIVLPEMEKQGVRLDASVAADEVSAARPYPFMLYKLMDAFKIINPRFMVKVGDTVVDVQEGLSAGCWTVAISGFSPNLVVSSEEYESILSDELQMRREQAHRALQKSGAHYVIPSIQDLPAVVADINYRLSKGETPALVSDNHIVVHGEQVRCALKR